LLWSKQYFRTKKYNFSDKNDKLWLLYLFWRPSWITPLLLKFQSGPDPQFVCIPPLKVSAKKIKNVPWFLTIQEPSRWTIIARDRRSIDETQNMQKGHLRSITDALIVDIRTCEMPLCYNIDINENPIMLWRVTKTADVQNGNERTN